MEEKKETNVENIGEDIAAKAEDVMPAEDNPENAVDDDIQYTFVVPKGEVYREPDPEEPGEIPEAVMAEPEPEGIPEPVMVEPEPAEGS